MKKLLAILLALVMVLCVMAGCSNDDDEGGSKDKKASIVGDWEAEWDMTDMMNEMMTEEADMGDYIKIKDFTVIWEIAFDEDGTYKMSFDMDDALDNLMDTLKDGLVKMLEDQIEAEDLDMTVDEMLDEANMDLDDLVDTLRESIENELEQDMKELSGKYELDGDKLYMSDDEDSEVEKDTYTTIELSSKKMKFVSTNEELDDEIYEQMLPMTFKRK